jgi:hypothetical protein
MPKQPGQIIGSFFLRDEGDGCLTSKYHHGDSLEGPFTEACKLTDQSTSNERFVGTYRTVWLEDDNEHLAAELLIERHPRNTAIFRLFWRDAANNNRNIFEGTAMLFGTLLVGTYWDF